MQQSKLDSFFGTKSTPPAAKKAKTREDVLESNKKYDAEKRERSFQQEWLTSFTWLLYSNVEKKMYCRPCRAIYGPYSVRKVAPDKYAKYASGPLITGSTNFKKHALTVHDKSEGHIEALTKEWAKSASSHGETDADKILDKLNKADYNRLCILFNNAHAIAHNSRPFKDFVWMAQLDMKKGLTVGKTYINDKQCAKFVSCISETERIKIISFLSEVKFVSVLSDGSIDVSVSENEAIYLRTSLKGKVSVFFLEMQSVERANAIGIFSVIRGSMKHYSDVTSNLETKLVGFCCDGASVNVGKSNGVISIMHKEINDSIVLLHCIAHRLELSFKQAVKGYKLYTQLNSLLSELFKFYHTSALQLENLKTAFKACEIPIALPHRIGGTRWVAHISGALEQLWKGYTAFHQHLGQVAIDNRSPKQPKAKCLVKMLESKPLLLFASHIHDCLTIVSRLSKEIQKDDAGIYHANQQLKSTMSCVKRLKESPGPHLRNTEGKDEYQGQKLNGDAKSFDTVKDKIIDDLITCMESRFSNITEGLLAATQIADFSTWPLEFDESFGNEAVVALVSHFQSTLQHQGLNVELMDMEWNDLKTALFTHHNIADLSWEIVNGRYYNRCSNILGLVDLILALPASSALCERGFSVMKQTKSEYRNRMKVKTLSNLMTIKLHSCDIPTFDPKEAIQYWYKNSQCARRPNFNETKEFATIDDNASTSAKVETDEAEQQPMDKVTDEDGHSDYESDVSMYDSDEAMSIEDACDLV